MIQSIYLVYLMLKFRRGDTTGRRKVACARARGNWCGPTEINTSAISTTASGMAKVRSRLYVLG